MEEIISSDFLAAAIGVILYEVITTIGVLRISQSKGEKITVNLKYFKFYILVIPLLALLTGIVVHYIFNPDNSITAFILGYVIPTTTETTVKKLIGINKPGRVEERTYDDYLKHNNSSYFLRLLNFTKYRYLFWHLN